MLGSHPIRPYRLYLLLECGMSFLLGITYATITVYWVTSGRLNPATCPLRTACTASRRGRTIAIHPQEAVLQQARAVQRDPAWQERYKTNRPGVERKISHFTRRAWGGRKARTRGLARIRTDLDTRAAALNWARLAVLGLSHDRTGWILPGT